jgi:chromosomal replication initiation ATPase DnaA
MLPANDHQDPIVQYLASLSTAELDVALATTMGLLAHAKGYQPLLRTIGHVLEALDNKTCRIETVSRQIGWKHGVTLEEMRGPSRDTPIVWARFEAWWILRKTFKLPYPRIGAWYSGRNHATIYNGVLRHEARLKNDA